MVVTVAVVVEAGRVCVEMLVTVDVAVLVAVDVTVDVFVEVVVLGDAVVVTVVVDAGSVWVDVLVRLEVTVEVTVVVTGGSVAVDVLEVVVVVPWDPQRAVPAARAPTEPPTTISLFGMLEDCAFPSTPQLVP